MIMQPIRGNPSFVGNKKPGDTNMIPEVLHKSLSVVTGGTSSTPGIGDGTPFSDTTNISATIDQHIPDLQPMTISLLFVDDEPSLLDIGKIFLERTPGFTVTTADSAASALHELEMTPFDAIVSDYQMPGMDGIAFLQEIRSRSLTLPFILFTGKGREEIVIKALNSGADYYLQKGGDTRSQYAELAHKVKRSVEQRRAESDLKRKHEVLQAILSASPQGIAYVRSQKVQWVNNSLAAMLGYRRDELKGLHLENLYENSQIYDEIGRRIQQDLKDFGKSTIITRFKHKSGFSIDAEIHIAPLDAGNLHLGHMIVMSDISRKVAAVRELKNPNAIPHLELTPVIEVDQNGKITYYNDAAINAIIHDESRGSLEEFFPHDLLEILTRMDETDTDSISRDVNVGNATYRVHITLSAKFRIARLSAVNTREA
jgi:PAS domain S-box-containing protein